MFASTLYRSSPLWMQEGLISARAYGRARLREGKAFERHAADASRTQWLDDAGLADLHRRHVERLLAVAAHSVPLYRSLGARVRRTGDGARSWPRCPCSTRSRSARRGPRSSPTRPGARGS